ncbi:hypothetical protein T11_7157 [Trichinella zimbabwensis]|uniref:Uncharacterized protein n=1 Tax=Trichinella zimbabwensis TaxID=268475 RepID=A0A0V1GPQ1_9BILA|nr:hypothetical protein T11_7157 [Trichinella zimbabwensis]
MKKKLIPQALVLQILSIDMTLSPYSTHQSYSLSLNSIRQRSRTSFSQVSNDPSRLSIVLFAASEAEIEEKKKLQKPISSNE